MPGHRVHVEAVTQIFVEQKAACFEKFETDGALMLFESDKGFIRHGTAGESVKKNDVAPVSGCLSISLGVSSFSMRGIPMRRPFELQSSA